MHTKGKWTWEVGENRVRIFSSEDSDYVLASISTMKGVDIGIANAKRICQMHNSFDDLLEVLKYIIKWDDYIANEDKLPKALMTEVKRAIAKAEGV